MANILLIDTSADTGTIAISTGGEIKSVKYQHDNRNHAATINLLTDELLQETGISFSQLSAIAVCGGPGSYTGLRIALSTAKGLCYALNIPLMLHNKLFLLGYQAYLSETTKYNYFLPLLIARENEYFVALYNNKFETLIEPVHVNRSGLYNITTDLHNILLIGNELSGDALQKPENISNVLVNVTIDINRWAEYAEKQYYCNDFVNLSTAEPFYLKQVYTHK
jgi:tRNA threonylcarbamoyladenosine biosynthesis protein TsaB